MNWNQGSKDETLCLMFALYNQTEEISLHFEPPTRDDFYAHWWKWNIKPLHPMSGLIGAEMQMPGCIGAAAVSKALHSDESQLIIWKYLVRSIIPFGPKGPGHTSAEGPSGPRQKFRYSIKASKYTETYAVVLLRDFTKSFENNWSAATFQSNPQKPSLQ